MLKQLKTLALEMRGNAAWDLAKLLLLAGVALIGVVVYRLLVWIRDLPQDRVVDLMVFLGAFILMVISYALRPTSIANPDTPKKRIWPAWIAVAVAIVMGITVLVIRGFRPEPTNVSSVTAQSSPTPAIQASSPPSPSLEFGITPLVKVQGRRFMNEKIPLDGYHYFACEFINPTFVFNGTDRFALERNVIRGPILVSTDNRTVAAAFTVAQVFGSSGIPLRLVDRDLKPIDHRNAFTVIEPSRQQ